MAVLACALAVGAQEPPELALVATERQLGPVAYRDPIGVPSPA